MKRATRPTASLRSLRSFLLAAVVGAGVASAVHAASADEPAGRELIQRRCQYAYVLLWKKDFAAAEEQFRKVLQEAPDVADAQVGLGLTLERAGKPDEAFTAFAKVKPDVPDYAAAAAGQARILVSKGQFKEALKRYQDLRAKSLLTDEYRLAYVEALAYDRNYEEALKELVPLRQRPQMATDVAKIEGQILAWSGRSEEAIPKLVAALEQSPKDDVLRLDLARAYFLSHKPADAIKTLEDLSQEVARSGKAIMLRVDVLTSQKQYDEALTLLAQAAKDHPDDTSLLLRQAEILSWTKQYDKSIATYRDILNRNPHDIVARSRLAEVLSWAGRFDEAAEEFRKALGESEP